jgi:hypothetical protein
VRSRPIPAGIDIKPIFMIAAMRGSRRRQFIASILCSSLIIGSSLPDVAASGLVDRTSLGPSGPISGAAPSLAAHVARHTDQPNTPSLGAISGLRSVLQRETERVRSPLQSMKCGQVAIGVASKCRSMVAPGGRCPEGPSHALGRTLTAVHVRMQV